MMENNQNNAFQYTYSAEEQAEIKAIRSKYVPKEENKMEQLQRLDASVTQKAAMYAIIVGVIGALIMGTGMSCCMVWAGTWFVPGVVIGLIGMAVTAMAYPVYNHVLRKERERIAPEVLRLTDELLKRRFVPANRKDRKRSLDGDRKVSIRALFALQIRQHVL